MTTYNSPTIERENPAYAFNQQLVDAFHDTDRVRDPIHNLYRYPARFSPRFVSHIIENLSSPGDLILDPFLGGGTTAVEARLSGRRFLGGDISELACFVARTRSTPLTESDCDSIDSSISSFSMKGRPKQNFSEYYFRNLMSPDTHHLAQVVSKLMAWSEGLEAERLRGAARVIVLRAAQIAIDGRLRFPTETEFLVLFQRVGKENVKALRDYSRRTKQVDKDSPIGRGRFRSRIINDTAENLGRRSQSGLVKLMITSPPYPGIHVLYHRWQLKGGKETPLPFLIAGKKDGHGLAHYTMNARSRSNNGASYFNQIKESYRGVRNLLHEDATVVQLVAFSKPRVQLEQYLEVMDEAGYRQADLSSNLVRLVPNRRWHAMAKGTTSSSREFLLTHKVK